ncbi:glycolate oxidase subunit GlcE [Ancylobacter polymorphus]|uniref:Glycolate oxidase subunit GlcE n=1 Tax=Ancylobacter polymorphus TaxID=223390 RepID=A0A9E7A206_9HYPH|nr:glycolate oxidase subunit GlcE [Ancylobacter polymorphus]UOK73095.1 glycolate oxidase subunit GlcE [Ancylobacter polymorphus]
MILTPDNEEDAGRIVSEAARRGTPLAISGGGTKACVGRPVGATETLSSSGLFGITLYEPSELVVSARAGTPLQDVVSVLHAEGQDLPFEPIDLRPLLDTEGTPTIGAVAATNLSGPRRIMAGAARDALLGVRFINGRGEAIKSGGRVMKNVTGLDLARYMSGSWGTLGFLTEVTFKVLPSPRDERTLILKGLADQIGIAALSVTLGSPYEVTGAAHVRGARGPSTLVRIEGAPFSVEYRSDQVTRMLKPYGQVTAVAGEDSRALWRDIAQAEPVAEPRGRAVWRISAPPQSAPAITESIGRAVDADWFYDWGGGLIWLATADQDDAGAQAIRAALGECGGHATLMRASAETRRQIEVFEPLAPPLAALARNLKTAFDPSGIFNPGRMYAGG